LPTVRGPAPFSRTLCLFGMTFLLALPACVHADKSYPAPSSEAWSQPAETRFGRNSAAELASHGEETGFYVLGSGVEAFATRFLMLDAAEQAIDVQYYIWHDDMTSNFLLSGLLRAADRGVRVRLLLDDLGSPGLDDILSAADFHPNLEVRLFNAMARGPLPGLARLLDLVSRPRRLNHRMHNKMLAVDGAAAVVGGRNVGDAYFGASEYVNFADLDVFVFGPIMPVLGESFDLYWSSEFTSPLAAWPRLRAGQEDYDALRARLTILDLEIEDSAYAERVRGARLMDEIREGRIEYFMAPAVVVADRPEKVAGNEKDAQTHISMQLEPIFEQVESELDIVSPYFVPGREFTDWLTDMVEGGVSVNVLTNSLAATDVSAVHAGYSKYRKDLLQGGVGLYELMPTGGVVQSARRQGLFGSSAASLHAKTFSFDREAVFVGSMNLDPRSVDLNTELGIVLFSPEVAQNFDTTYEKLTSPAVSWQLGLSDDTNPQLTWTGSNDGEMVVVDKDPETSWWDRFTVGFLRLLPIEGLL
jgi:putative cardiolipin synthase